MSAILSYLVPIMACLMISMACAIIAKRGGFSVNIFLTCMAICIPVMIWVAVFPPFMIVVSILCISGVLFRDSDGDSGE